MSIDADLTGFLAENHRAVLVTRRGNGDLQSSPVACALDAEGRLLVSTPSRSAKARNLARDPRAVLTVVTDGWYGPWAQVTGSAEVIAMPDALDLLVDYYRAASGTEHPDWEEYRASMIEQDRVAIRITLEAGVFTQ